VIIIAEIATGDAGDIPSTGQMPSQALIWLNEHRLGHYLLSSISVHCALKQLSQCTKICHCVDPKLE